MLIIRTGTASTASAASTASTYNLRRPEVPVLRFAARTSKLSSLPSKKKVISKFEMSLTLP